MSPSFRLSPANPALSHLSAKDRELFCAYGAGPQIEPSHDTMLAAIEEAAALNPDNIAVQQVLPDGTLSQGITYAELCRRANTVATKLRSLGVTNGDAVPLFIKRGVNMIVAIVAILKVGACYVPQDARLAPGEHLARIMTATQARVVLTLSEFMDKLPTFANGKVVAVDEVLKEGGSMEFAGAEREVRGEDRCYIIFTSGTTGTPKGVQVTHRNVANVLLTDPMSLGMRPGLKVSQILSVAFDMGAWEMLGCISHGATLVIRGRKIADAVKHADVVISTPTVLGTLDCDEMQHVKTAAVAGEPCSKKLAHEWSQFCRFYNACGPTEVTIINTAKLVDDTDGILSIGKPTANNTVYVLDGETGRACDIGQVGEMWGGGECVTMGYLNQEELTGTRYVKDRFLAGNRKMYRTGDLGRWTANGELEHVGRVDDQVKIKGFRVELDGVSAATERVQGVQKAVTLKVGDELLSFVTPSWMQSECVKEGIARVMPYYCVPKRVVCMDSFPETTNGKVDKRALMQSMQEGEQSDGRATVRAKSASPAAAWQSPKRGDAFAKVQTSVASLQRVLVAAATH